MIARDQVRLFDHFDANFSTYVDAVREFLHQPGFSHTGEGIRESAELTRQALAKFGAEEARIIETDGYPVVFGRHRSNQPGAKTVAIYSHYDMVPVTEADWTVPPLSASLVDAATLGLPASLGQVICSRGAWDSRGSLLTAVLAIHAMQQVSRTLPVNVVWVVEGEEEIGAPHLRQFIDEKLDELMAVDAVWMPHMNQDIQGVMQIYRGYRGTVKVELEIKGGEWGGTLSGKDLWSAYLPLADAPMMRMIRVLDSLVDDQDRPAIDGLQELVWTYGEDEEAELRNLREQFDEPAMMEALGIRRFKNGRPGKELFEQFLMQPMVNVVGLVGGYIGPRVYTTLPMRVAAKLDIRFPPHVTPADVLKLLRAHLDRRGFREVVIHSYGGYESSLTAASDPIVQASIQACKAHDCEFTVWPQKPSVAPFNMFNRPPLNKPLVANGMGHGGRWHQANEYITVSGIRSLMRYMATFLHCWAEA